MKKTTKNKANAMTNEDAKKAAILKAYGKFVEGTLMIRMEDGWATGGNVFNSATGEWQLDVDRLYDGFCFRPKSLSGIETNNGWNRISGPEDLPKEPGLYTVLNNDGIIEDFRWEDHFRKQMVWLEYFTHWRPAEEIPKPIY